MTCVIGLVEGDTLYLGGDSAGVGGLSIRQRVDDKVFKNGPFLMGFTTSFRMGQLLRYKFKPPVQQCADDMEYLVSDFVDTVRSVFSNNGFGDAKNDHGGDFLVGYKNKLYQVHSDFQIARSRLPYEAVGCGAEIALGSMYAASQLPPVERIKLALEAASVFSAGVCKPFKVLKQKATK